MKTLRNLLPALLLIISLPYFAQKPTTLSDDDYGLITFFPASEEYTDILEETKSVPEYGVKSHLVKDNKAIEYQRYDVVVADGLSNDYVYHFISNNKRFNFSVEESVVTIDQESRNKKFLMNVSYDSVSEEVFYDTSDDEVYVSEIKVYRSTSNKIKKVIAVKSYFEEDSNHVNITYTVIMNNNEVYTFLK